ncbi:carboxymuconolactone decarboxylase family protein [Geotalea toluenoxydans]|uniref:carboxymuconolactone decarboxylase family protein n=1 Tax=Geotalea toluenoxydans TaxID=421624 RepID=UPI0006D12870|nr:carboxymuconolactone decarboxylase family protein [Geotalea toluenoxydans]
MALEEKVRELIAVGASIAANNPPEVKYHISRAREFGADDGALNDAVDIGKQVRRGAASKTDAFALSLATTPVQRERGGCRKGGGGRGNGQGDGCGCNGQKSEQE